MRSRLDRARLLFCQGEDEPTAEDGSGTRWPELDELSERLALPPALLRRVCGAEGWSESRDALAARVAAARISSRQALNARKAMEVDDRTLRLGEAGLQIIQRAYAEMMKRAQIAVRAEGEQAAAGVSVPYVSADISPNAILTLSRALESLHRTMRAATGDPIPELAHARQEPAITLASIEINTAQAAPDDLVRDIVGFYAELEQASAARAGQPAIIGEIEVASNGSNGNGHAPG